MRVKKPKPFYRWIIKQCHRESAIGDLAKDIRNDEDFPKEAISYRQAIRYLKSKNASDLALDMLSRSWSEFVVNS